MIERQQERRSIMKKWMKAGIAAVLAAFSTHIRRMRRAGAKERRL